jgi:hypothetical protein
MFHLFLDECFLTDAFDLLETSEMSLKQVNGFLGFV